MDETVGDALFRSETTRNTIRSCANTTCKTTQQNSLVQGEGRHGHAT
mgnify:CR=1 FL=1